MIRGVYSVRDGALERGFFTNSVPALFERIRSPSTRHEYTFFEFVRHSYSSGAFGDAHNRSVAGGESELIEALASRLGVDSAVLEERIDRSLPDPRYTPAQVRVEVCLASGRTPRDSDVKRLEEAGWGYVEFDPSEQVVDPYVRIPVSDALYAAK